MPSYVCGASVGYLDTDGTLYSIKVSMDGFKSCVGACLLMYYNTYDKVCELVHYGNMHEIGRCISEDQFDFEREKERLKNLDYTCRYQIANYCIPLYKKFGYKHLDERPDMTPKMYYTGCLGGYSENLLDAISESNMFRSMNNYLFIDGEWWYRYDSYGEFRKLTAEGCEIEPMRNETIDKKYPYEGKMIAIANRRSDRSICQKTYDVVTFEFYGDLFTLAKDILSEWKNDSIADMYAKIIQDEKIYYDAEMETAWMLSSIDEFFEKYNYCNFIFLFSGDEWWVKEKGKRATKLRFMTQDSFDSYSDYQNYMFMKECGFNPKPSSSDTLDEIVKSETEENKDSEEPNMNGIKTCPVFDQEYFHVGDMVKITCSSDLQYKNTGWKNRPASPFNAIILDVMHEKILICYYCKQANKQVGRFAIPVRLVADGTIKIDIISRYKE